MGRSGRVALHRGPNHVAMFGEALASGERGGSKRGLDRSPLDTLESTPDGYLGACSVPCSVLGEKGVPWGVDFQAGPPRCVNGATFPAHAN
mmetsp:Transcript_25663/g.46331  ORF Transcript_25663/g.46331 Transcript_25663/m.46331 type:complete len:91 (-) Transcript_25663:518-790(-)